MKSMALKKKMKCPKKLAGECKAKGSQCSHAVNHDHCRWCGISDNPCPVCIPVVIKK